MLPLRPSFFPLVQWVLLNVVFCLFTAIPTGVWYQNQAANGIFALIVFIFGTWYGAGFYIEVFSRRYRFRRATLDKRKAKKIADGGDDDDDEEEPDIEMADAAVANAEK